MICVVHEVRPGDVDLYRNRFGLVLALLNAELDHNEEPDEPRGSHGTILDDLGAPYPCLYTHGSRFDVVCRA